MVQGRRGMGIRTKMILSFSVVLLLLQVVGVAGIYGMRTVSGGYRELVDNDLELLESLLEFRGMAMEELTAVRGHIITGDDAGEEWYRGVRAEADAVRGDIEKAIKAEVHGSGSGTTEAVWQEIKDHYKMSGDSLESLLAAYDQNKAAEIPILLAQSDELIVEFHDEIEAWITDIHTEVEAVDRGLDATSATLTTAVIALCAVALVAGLTLAVTTSTAIAKPLMALTSAAAQAAGGDLAVKLPEVRSKDEVRSLSDAFSTMVSSLISVIKEASESAEQVASTSEELSATSEETSMASGQISKTAEEMSKASQQQSETATATASSMSQLTAAVDQVARGAQAQMEAIQVTSEALRESEKSLGEVNVMLGEVGQEASQNVKAATDGSKAVNNLVESMGRIRSTTESASVKIGELNQLSADITSIVNVIDDIASQTNLLALNAAIEAARAGEYGRGFAVVADEVRRLAERSLAETKSITELIDKVSKAVNSTVQAIGLSVREVENGSSVAQQAGSSLDAILEGASETQAVVKRLESATINLKKSSEMVDGALEKIVSVTEENSAATEEMAASTRGVQELVDSVASVSEESAAATEEMLASTEQMNASINQVAESSQSLAGMAQRLQDALKKFRV